jgi:hypothetical protein
VGKLKQGDRVMILRGAGYDDKYIDMIGTVKRTNTYISGGQLGVLLDDYYNDRSEYGCYWFKQTRLFKMPTAESVDERKDIDTMKRLNALNLNLTKGIDYDIVTVKFLDDTTGRKYYFVLYDKNIAPGMTVVVKTAHHGFAVAQVVDYDDTGLTIEKMECDRQVVCAVDLSPYYNRLNTEKELWELKKRMDAKVEQLQKNAIYEMMAEKDADLKHMLEMFKGTSSMLKREE